MKKKLTVIVFVTVLGGCANWFPANVKEVSEGTYSISATGNSFISIDSMKEKVIKKAEKKCGAKGFNFVKEPEVEFRKDRDYVNGGYQHYKVITTVVECKQKL